MSVCGLLHFGVCVCVCVWVCVCVCVRARTYVSLAPSSSSFVRAGSSALSITERESPTLVRPLGTIFLSPSPDLFQGSVGLALVPESPFEYSALYSRHKKMA